MFACVSVCSGGAGCSAGEKTSNLHISSSKLTSGRLHVHCASLLQTFHFVYSLNSLLFTLFQRHFQIFFFIQGSVTNVFSVSVIRSDSVTALRILLNTKRKIMVLSTK